WSSLPLLLLGLFALSQNITVHPAAIEMKERYLRIVPQRSGGKAALELAQHILGHIVQVGEWLRADLDPDELDQLGIGMHDALDAVGDGGGIRGEEAGIKTPDAAGRGDCARNQE